MFVRMGGKGGDLPFLLGRKDTFFWRRGNRGQRSLARRVKGSAAARFLIIVASLA